MANPASPTSTEGYGFTYADLVGACALLALLDRSPFAELDLGVVTKVQFGQRPEGWLFDDMVLTLEKQSVNRHLAISIKSSSHITESGISDETANLIWAQFELPGPFDSQLDILALAQPSPSPKVVEELAEMTRWANKQDEGQLETWMQPGVGNQTKRALVESVVKGQGRNNPQSVFRSFRALFFDLDAPYDSSKKEAIRKCLEVLQSPTEELAESLWIHLCQAAQARGSAATYDLETLVSKLSSHFIFRAHPLVEQDIKALQLLSRDRHLSSVKDVIGTELRLPTIQGEGQLQEALKGAQYLLFVGESGTGKSVVLKHFVENAPEGELRLYFRADLTRVNPKQIAEEAGMKHSLSTCLAAGRFQQVTLVVDQIDRLLTEDQIGDVNHLIQSLKSLTQRTRFVFGCQSAEAEHVISRISVALRDTSFQRVVFKPDEEEMFTTVMASFPKLKNLVFRKELRPILLRAKNLDLFVGRSDRLDQLSGQEVTSQKQFIDWFWDEYVLEGQDGLARSKMMAEIAELQATTFNSTIQTVALSDIRIVGSLMSSGLVTGNEHYLTFQHDQYGDWARLRLIESKRTLLPTFFIDLAINPLWLRAMRLWSTVLLETEGANAWIAVFDNFSAPGATSLLLRDSMLDGLALAGGAYQYLTVIRERLFSEKGKLLQRFLARFLFASSSPDEELIRALSGGSELGLLTYRSEFRVPHFYLWGPVVRFIAENSEECRTLARDLTVQVIQPWLEAIPKGGYLADPITDLAIYIASDYLGSHHYREENGIRNRIFRCLFLAFIQRPEEVRPVILRAIGRTGEDRFQSAEIIEGVRYFEESGMFGHEHLEVVGPWPDGPIAPPNDEFRQFVLMGGGIREMYQCDPDLAREVILAACIKEPWLESPSYSVRLMDRNLSIEDDRQFYPPFYDKGFLRILFQFDKQWALNIILTIVEFAAERSENAQEQEQVVNLMVNGTLRQMVGALGSYGWFRGNHSCPDLVASALMCLEHQLTGEMEAKGAHPLLDAIIARNTSLPVAGLLVSVGKQFPKVFVDKLRHLHFNELIHSIDIRISLNENFQLISWTSQSEEELTRAREWHLRPHRKQHLKQFALFALDSAQGKADAEEARNRWTILPASEGEEYHQALGNLITVYNPDSYTVEKHEDGILIQCQLPDEQRKAAEAHMEAASKEFAFLALPMQCRRIIDGEDTIGEGQLLGLIDQARNLSDGNSRGVAFMTSIDARCGAAAVAVLFFPELLTNSEDLMKWCTETLIEAAVFPRARNEYDTDVSILDHSWIHFAAQAIPKLWLQNPNDTRIRQAIASLIEDGHYNVTSMLVKALFGIRVQNPRLYYQAMSLQRYHLIEEIRVIERDKKASSREYQPIKHAWPKYHSIRKAFIRNNLSPVLQPMPPPVLDNHIAKARFRRHERNRAHPTWNVHRYALLLQAFPWSSDDLESGDRNEIYDRFREVFDEFIAEIRNGDESNEGSVEWHQYEWQLFSLFGQIATHDQTGQLMKEWSSKIVNITPIAENQSEQFVKGVFTVLLHGEGPSAPITANWITLLYAYLGTDQPKPESWEIRYGYQDWWNWIIGNDPLTRRYSWNANHKAFINDHKRIVESWVRYMSHHDSTLKDCLSFLRIDACSDLRFDACIWLDEEIGRQVSKDRDTKTTDELAYFLAISRSSVARERNARQDVFKAFLNLTALVSLENNRLGMQLYEDVATLN